MLRSVIGRVWLIAVTLAALSTVALAQGTNLPRRSSFPGAGTIRGRVVTPSGASVGTNIKIKVSNFSTSGAVNYTDTNGEFTFSGLTSGTYNLEVFADPSIYDPVTETVNMPPNGRITVMIYLRAKTGTMKKKPASNVVSVGELDQKAPDGARKEFDKAVERISKGDSEQAIKHLNRALTIFPEYLVARSTLGAEYLKLKRLDEAIEQFELAIKVSPAAFNPRLYLGVALVQQKKFSDATQHLGQAVSLNRADASAHFYLGIALLGVDDLVEAESALRKALSIGGPAYSVAHYYMAHVHLKTGDRDQAIRDLKTYLEESPTGEQAPHARGLLEKLTSGK